MKSLLALLLVLSRVTFCDTSDPALPQKYKVGLCIVATGGYLSYAQELIVSARDFFLKDHEVSFFLFTDGEVEPERDVIRIHHKREGWPHDTLKRSHIYYTHRALFKEMDYVYAIDADMKFVASIGSEILGDLVGVRHPGFLDKRGPYEKNKRSTARVFSSEGSVYFAGGFYGARQKKFVKLLKTMVHNIDKDLKKKYIAKWHDESHLNRYFIDHPPSTILTSSYCFPADWKEFPLEKKIVALTKDHQALRK